MSNESKREFMHGVSTDAKVVLACTAILEGVSQLPDTYKGLKLAALLILAMVVGASLLDLRTLAKKYPTVLAESRASRRE